MNFKVIPFKSLNSKYFNILLGFAFAAGILFLLSNLYFVQNKGVASEPVDGFQKIYSPYIPSQLDFAGERVPQENFEVFERIEREFLVNTYWHSFTILAIKRANRWFPVIEPILKKNNIPSDFKYLAVIESGLMNAVSPAGATGFWQMIESIGKKYGLEINDEVDERYDVEKSTEAACSYLKEAYGLFKNWTLTAASFNMGINGVGKQLDRQKTNNYYNLVLNEETSRYIARIIALKEILKDPKKYGYYISDDQLYKPLKSYNIEVKDNIANIADFGIKNGVNYKIIKTYNPWLRDIELVNKSHKTYAIKIPEKGSIDIIK
ncbi:MAG: lytic transglycosylase domain-containing protein [Ignavibacteriaceae bacterium]|nr:lytic transglycosylase domain-containing protein [Ignavibacteriaceae bacterium]